MLNLAYETGTLQRPWLHDLGTLIKGSVQIAALGAAVIGLATVAAWFSVVIFP